MVTGKALFLVMLISLFASLIPTIFAYKRFYKKKLEPMAEAAGLKEFIASDPNARRLGTRRAGMGDLLAFAAKNPKGFAILWAAMLALVGMIFLNWFIVSLLSAIILSGFIA